MYRFKKLRSSCSTFLETKASRKGDLILHLWPSHACWLLRALAAGSEAGQVLSRVYLVP